MPVLLKNVVFDTQRSTFSPLTGVTTTPATYLHDQDGRVAQLQERDYVVLPQGALKSEYTLNVDMAVDVVLGDVILNIRLGDRVTPWFIVAANESWKVLFIHPTQPGFLANKRCYIGRFIGGGVSAL